MLAHLKLDKVQGRNIFFRSARVFVLLGICTFWFIQFEPAPCDYLFSLAIVLWLADNMFYRKGLKLGTGNWLLAGFILTNVVGLAFSSELAVSARFTFITFYLSVFYIFLRQLCLDKNIRENVIKIYLGGALFEVVLIWVVIIATSIWQEPQKVAWLIMIDKYDNIRPLIFFKDPNVLGSFIVPAATYSMWRFLKGAQTSGKQLLLFCLSLGAIFLTFSRGALVSLVLGCLLIFCMTPASLVRRIKVVAASLVVFAALFVACTLNSMTNYEVERIFPFLPQVHKGITSYGSKIMELKPGKPVVQEVDERSMSDMISAPGPSSIPLPEKQEKPTAGIEIKPHPPLRLVEGYDAGGRFYAWWAGMEIFKKRPLLGSGSGSFEYLSPAIEEELSAKVITPSAHNLYIRVLAENGIIGSALLVCFFIYSWRSAMYAKDNIWIKAALIGLLVNSLFIDTLHYRHLWLLFAIL